MPAAFVAGVAAPPPVSMPAPLAPLELAPLELAPLELAPLALAELLPLARATESVVKAGTE